MSILDALPGIAAGAFSGLFRDAVLITPSIQYPDGQGGFTSMGRHEQPCKAILETYGDMRRAAAQIPVHDRKATVLGATLGGVVPLVSQKLAIEGREWTIIAVDRDPAAATYELQVR